MSLPVRTRRAVGVTGLALVTALGVGSAVACEKADDDTAEAASDRTVTITIGDDACTVDPAEIDAGKTTFKVSNSKSESVTEAELVDSTGRIVGERENLTPGLSASFSLNLDAGDYNVYCPGATTENTPFHVTGGGSAGATSAGPIGDQLAEGVAGYADYVKAQTSELVTATKAFADAVTSGDVEQAKQLYGPARLPYERIEPVAESFGDLDPAIDARINDVADPSEWTGFHPLEQLLWEQNTTEGGAELAAQLVDDVTTLNDHVQGLTYQPADLANGATGLLDEVAKSKITGEEEAYSHLDLLDFFGNVDGAKRAYDLLAPALKQIDPDLVSTLDTRFAEVNQGLAAYKDGASYVPYTQLTQDQVKDLAAKVDALAEPLSEVAAKVADYK